MVIAIKFAKGPDVYVPSVFTPNGDMLNDVFGITAVNVKVKSFRVFNRFGECVFVTSDPANTWNGKVNNKLQQPGVYVWLVEAIGPGDIPFVKRGAVMLMQ
jgi:gliding motility-associated-like protein